MISNMEPGSLSAEALHEFTTIGSYLTTHAPRVPLEQQIAFGLHAQRYCRALGLNLVRLPGEPPRLPRSALEHVRLARYTHWSETDKPDAEKEIAGLCADLLQNALEAGPFTFEEMEHHCQQHGYLTSFFRRHDSISSRRARLGLIFQKHKNRRLPNDCILHIDETHHKRLYRITRRATPAG